MALYQPDFTLDAVETSPPTGWTKRGHTGHTWTVDASKDVTHVLSSNLGRTRGISLNAVDADASADVDILLTATDKVAVGAFARATLSSDIWTGYRAALTDSELGIYHLNATTGSGSRLAFTAAAPVTDAPIALRFRINGTALKVKWWSPADISNPEADEPGTWGVEVTNSAIATAGSAGVGSFSSGAGVTIGLYRRVAIATAGEVATFAAAGGGIVGTASATLPALTVSGAGNVAAQGSGAVTLPALTSAATGTALVSGAATIVLPALASVGAGAVQTTGTAAASLPSLTASAGAAVTVTGTGAATMPQLVASASAGGAGSTTGTGAASLPMLTTSGAGVVQIIGGGVTFLPTLIVGGFGVAPAMGSGTALLPGLTVGGVGAAQVVGSGAAILPMLIVGVDGSVQVTGYGAATLPMLIAAATEAPPVVLVGPYSATLSVRTVLAALTVRPRAMPALTVRPRATPTLTVTDA